MKWKFGLGAASLAAVVVVTLSAVHRWDFQPKLPGGGLAFILKRGTLIGDGFIRFGVKWRFSNVRGSVLRKLER